MIPLFLIPFMNGTNARTHFINSIRMWKGFSCQCQILVDCKKSAFIRNNHEIFARILLQKKFPVSIVFFSEFPVDFVEKTVKSL